VYLHIRRQLLAPPAASLVVGVTTDMPVEDIFLSVMAFRRILAYKSTSVNRKFEFRVENFVEGICRVRHP
jgi:hypothetical protein